MPLSGKNPQADVQPQTLPLFRPEALAAQERLHGDVLRIRPLSPRFFAWLAAVIGAVILVYLFAGHTTPRVRAIHGPMKQSER